MKTYKIEYAFDGYGTVNITAKNKEEAETMFFEGDFNEEKEVERGQNYCIDEIEEEGVTKCGNCDREIDEDEDGIISDTINRCSRCKDL